MSRLSVVDEIFLRAHRGLGTPSALQGLWRTTDPIDRRLLERIHAALRTGPLGRRVIRPRIPGARPYWRRNDAAHPLRIAGGALAAADVLAWADDQGHDLDPEFAPGWRLSAATLREGGSVVVLTCSHTLADGRGLALAVDHALSGSPVTEYAPQRSDWSDAGRQWATVLSGTARALRRGAPGRPEATAPRRAAELPSIGAVLQFPAADWELAAAGRGGTPNSLFLSVLARMLWDSGFPEPRICAAVPVDTRDDRRVDNDMAMTEVWIERTDTPATLREKCRAAYEYRMSAPDGMPPELLQVLPGRIAYHLSRGAGERDILCSNIGTLPTSLTQLGPHHCTGVAARAIHPGLLSTALPRTRLSGYLCRIGHSYTLALVGLDPDHISSAGALADIAHAALDPLDVPVTVW
ncbi:hypothetical protein [Nocardia spumae]|uniref:hypothetical protein n=1 Tax=Nocardia spumae TaxID=2887190 RepID=UPI001D1592DD|nr:hypothetical protein [Nocardia spumae]